MISVEEALEKVVAASHPLAAIPVALADSLDSVLAEEIASDIDSPPYDKSLMDGYAVRSQDIIRPPVTLRVLEEVPAGSVPRRPVVAGTAVRLMTGSRLPAGADAVVMLEETEQVGSADVRIRQSRVTPQQNLMMRATCLARDEVVMSRGTLLTPARLGLLAEVGRQSVLVYGRPEVGILATGDELVPVHETPGNSQIRNSNGPMLAALAAECGAVPRTCGIAGDERVALKQLIAQGLRQHVLLVSGGVSAGKWDLVPEVLADLGVQQRFHKVAVKPGKPLWFGVHDSSLVFGLPGNPVSSFVCFQLFVRGAILALRGITPPVNQFRLGRLSNSFEHRADRTTFFPGRIGMAKKSTGEETNVRGDVSDLKLLPWKGSADLRTLADADCLVEFPAGQQRFDEGTVVRFVGLRDVAPDWTAF